MTPRHTIDDFVNAFGLKQKGKEYVGPCPVCKDGEDRFHVREGNAGPIFGCRYCIDGEQDADGSNAKQVLSLLRNGNAGALLHPHRAPHDRQRNRPSRNRYRRATALRCITIRTPTGNLYWPWSGGILYAMASQTRHSASGYRTRITESGAWLPTAPKGKLPMYGLPNIADTTGKVAIVEGEKCVHAAKGAWPRQTVTCWAGGTPAWDKTDWTPLAGREVSLVADADPIPEPPKPQYSVGHKAMQALAAHLHGLGCKVKIALPPVEWDNDIADWIAEQGKDGAARILGELLHDYEPPELRPEPPPKPPAEPFEIPAEPLDNNPHYRLLGLQGTGLAFALTGSWAHGNHRAARYIVSQRPDIRCAAGMVVRVCRQR